MKKLSKHHKNTIIVMSCLFLLLIIGFQNCGENNTTGNNTEGSNSPTTTLPSTSTIEVTGITDSNTPQQSWTWNCNNPPCTFRFHINQESTTYSFPQNQQYINIRTTTKTDVEGNYYLHIQAKKDEEESQVKTVSIVIAPTTGGKNKSFLVEQIDTDGSHVCSLKDGQVKCWGLNDKGQLGYGDTNNRGDGPNEIRGLANVNVHEPISGPNDDHLTEFIATGGQHTCALLKNKCIKCWGNNEHGQLGYSDTSNNFGDANNEMGGNLAPVGGLSFKVKTIATGEAHTCSVTSDDTVRCWGANDKGQLGQDSTADTFIEPDNIPDIDVHPEDPTKTQQENDGFLPKHVATGAKHTCVVLNNDCVKCWGGNQYGQLGYGDTEDRGDGLDSNSQSEMGANLPPVGGMNFKVKAIATGDWHTCAIMNGDDSVQCWGLNDKGQLGTGSTTDIDDATGLTSIDLGSNRTAKAIIAGSKHTCVTLDDDSMKCFGLNDKGQLGQGSTDDIGDANNEMGDNLKAVPVENSRTVASAGAGGKNTCFVLDDGKVKCWGNNKHGQLAKEHICSLGNGLGYSKSSSGNECNSPNANDVMGKTVDQIEYLSFE